jgi:hypothetical protein
MKKMLTAFAIVLLGLAAYVAAGPYLTARALSEAIHTQDAEMLSENVDFVALRANLKEQFNAKFMTMAAKELEDNPLGAFGMALGTKMVDGLVDAMITPSALANLMGRKTTIADSGDRPAGQTPPARTTPFEGGRYAVDSASKVSVWAKTGDAGAKEIRFVLSRDLLTWRLSNIVIPVDET